MAKAGRDPFAEFALWRRHAWGFWPEKGEPLTSEQQEIVDFNLALIADKERFDAHAAAFEKALAGIADEEVREQRRAEYGMVFRGHVFEDDLDLEDWLFPCELDFSGCAFKGNVWLSGATVSSYVRLNGAAVSGDVWLEGATVSGDVWLGGATVSGNVWLRRATVSGDVWLDDATVSGDASLSGAKVSGNVSLDGATVSGNVWLGGAKVSGNVWLSGAKVSGNVSLSLKCGDSTALFASDMAVGKNLLVQSDFPSLFNMRRIKVEGTASFSGSRFAEIPDFRDAIFARPPEVADMVVPGPKLDIPEEQRDRIIWFWRKTSPDPDDVAKLRKLKAMALASNDHEKDGEFFAKEMLAKRGREDGTRSVPELLLNTFYHLSSNFGQSIGRPLGWLVVSWFVFAALFTALAAQGLVLAHAVQFGALHSFKSVVPLLTSLVRFGGGPEGYRSVYEKRFDALVGTEANVGAIMSATYVQQFIGTVFLFLLLLALRNKFRLK